MPTFFTFFPSKLFKFLGNNFHFLFCGFFLNFCFWKAQVVCQKTEEISFEKQSWFPKSKLNKHCQRRLSVQWPSKLEWRAIEFREKKRWKNRKKRGKKDWWKSCWNKARGWHKMQNFEENGNVTGSWKVSGIIVAKTFPAWYVP